MGISDSMKKTTEDIVSSYDVRVKAIGELVKDTHNMLKGFRVEHKGMADKLKGDLAKGEQERLKDFKSMMDDIQKAIKEIETYTMNKLKEFHATHAEMAANLRKGNLRKGLEQGEADRLKTFKSMMAEIRKGIKEIETYTKNKLQEFSTAHADMSKELKEELTKYVDDMVKATKKLMGDIQKQQKERNTEVADLLDAFKTEREKMAAHWQSMAATMERKRGFKPEVEAEVKVRHVEEAIEEVKPEEEVVEEEAPPEMSLEEKVLEFIKRHPEGVKVSDMEEPIGVPRTRLGIIAKKLLDEGKVRKEENLYFPL